MIVVAEFAPRQEAVRTISEVHAVENEGWERLALLVLLLVISFVTVESTEKAGELLFHRLRLKALQVSSLYGTPEGVP